MTAPTNFQNLIDEIKELDTLLYALLYKARVVWDSADVSTAAVTIQQGKLVFFFNTTFWNTLTIQEQLFLIIHECFHVLLYHFVRFKTFSRVVNVALDLAVNHSIIRRFSFDEKDLPSIRSSGCWCDTVLPNETLLDTLSAEEYLFILQQKQEDVNYSCFDSHQGITQQDLDELFSQIKRTLKEQFPGTSDEEVDEIIKHSLEGLQPGIGTGHEEAATAIEKKSDPWKHFAKKLVKTHAQPKYHTSWLPDRRTAHVMPPTMFLPSVWEEEQEDKIEVVVLLDTSGSCAEYRKHFLGFAKALPATIFNVHLFGFNTSPYEIDLARPKFHGGGTSFHFFQQVFDDIKSERKLGFVFTDGAGTKCNLTHPDLWSWFLYYENSTFSCIPPGCATYDLSKFER